VALTVVLMYVAENIAHPNNAPNASVLNRKNITSALNEALR
jgi:hypothetical protein